MHQHAAATAATAALSVCLGSDAQYLDDCNANGVSDAVEIAQGLVSDCDGNGIPDTCDYAGESRWSSSGWNAPIEFYLTLAEPAASDVRLYFSGDGDFGDPDEYLGIYLDDQLVATVWEQDGLDCNPKQPNYQEAAVYIPQDVFNAAAMTGKVALRIVSSESVSPTDQCSTTVQMHYLRSVSDDCNGNGIPDSCDIANDAALDCNGNGTIDACEVSANTGYFDYDCDDDGVHDACQIAADPVLDSNADWVLDAHQISLGDFTLDRIIDGADLAYVLESWGSSRGGAADLNQDGLVDAFELARVLGNWGRYPTGWGVVLEAAPNPRVVTHDGFRAGIEATGLPWRVRDNKTGIELLLVPPGQFMMGCSGAEWCGASGCNVGEFPVHDVTLTRPFFLGRLEVTQAEWIRVTGTNPSSYVDLPRPVDRVSWNDIQAFNLSTGLRLPTEAEWEYSCRGGAASAYNNGSNDATTLSTISWFPSGVARGGLKWSNALGLHDMHLNVWEWTWDRLGTYPDQPVVDPVGPSSGNIRVRRGGGNGLGVLGCDIARASYRGAGVPSEVKTYVGFRAARTP